MEPGYGLKVHAEDNVATVFANGTQAGDTVIVRDKKGGEENIVARDGIPYGHKIALRDIKKGEPIVKYGEKLGIASADIARGMHVHVQNLDSARGRGDL